MRSPVVFIAAFLFLLANVGRATGAESILLAQTGAFLLGNAHRCGVPAERVERAGRIIRDMVTAAARDPGEAKEAGARFAEIYVASAYPRPDRNMLIPPCRVVVGQFERLEQHHQQAGLD